MYNPSKPQAIEECTVGLRDWPTCKRIKPWK